MVTNTYERTITLMPFITKEARKNVDFDFRLAEQHGDFCYAIYREFVDIWNKEPRWTTAHQIYKSKVIDTLWLQKFKINDKYTYPDAIAALHLAWQVFFEFKIIPYEVTKMDENGDIE